MVLRTNRKQEFEFHDPLIPSYNASKPSKFKPRKHNKNNYSPSDWNPHVLTETTSPNRLITKTYKNHSQRSHCHSHHVLHNHFFPSFLPVCFSRKITAFSLFLSQLPSDAPRYREWKRYFCYEVFSISIASLAVLVSVFLQFSNEMPFSLSMDSQRNYRG